MDTGSRRLRSGVLRMLAVAALLAGAASVAGAQSSIGDPGSGRPLPGAPPGTSDVAEGQGGVAVDAPAVAGTPGPSGSFFPSALQCGAMTPFWIGALAAGMLLLCAPVVRRR